jgi:predicted aspartyl protease
MTSRFTYEANLDPPGPVIPVRISAPRATDAVMLPMIVDTGADCTLVPSEIVRRLALPQVDVIGISGVGGGKQRATMHAALVELAGLPVLARVVAFGGEAILGRDLLNRVVVTLDGPELAVSVSSSSGRRRRKRRPPR